MAFKQTLPAPTWSGFGTNMLERPLEVQLYAYVTKTAPTTYIMSDEAGLYVPEQTVSRSLATTKPATFRPMNQHFRDSGFSDPNCQIHSHVTGTALFSSTDLGIAKTFMRTTLYPRFVWVVVNVRGDISARLELRDPPLFQGSGHRHIRLTPRTGVFVWLLYLLLCLCYNSIMNTLELRTVLNKVTPSLAEAVRTHPGYAPYSAETVLGSTCCGFATGLLQRYLKERHDIETTQMIGGLVDVPRNSFTHRLVEHVVLADDTHGAIIDPSYGQFMNLVGLSRQNFGAEINNTVNAAQFPTPRIALIDKERTDEFGAAYAERALGRRGVIAYQLLRRRGAGTAPDLNTTPLIHHSTEEATRVYQSIWDMSQYQPFDTDSSQYHIEPLHQRAYETLLEHEKSPPRAQSLFDQVTLLGGKR